MFSKSHNNNYCNYYSLSIKSIFLCSLLCSSLIIFAETLLFSASKDNYVLGHKNVYKNNIALEKRTLLRIKRQLTGNNDLTSNKQTSSNNANLSARGTQASDTINLNNNQQDGGANPEDKPAEEILNSLKCDFGTSDAPDLCKFKIIEGPNLLAKASTTTTWSHGSGKLALYQGGPLIDASAGNDTTGGYIFFETSNPYAVTAPVIAQPQLQPQHSTLSTNQSAPYILSNHNNNNNFYDQSAHNNNDPYSTITTSAFFKTTHRNNNSNNNYQDQQQQQDNNSFQRLTSARVAINSNSPGPAFMSPNLTAPGPSGMCLSFKYAIQGLSAEELRIHVNDHKTERSRQIWYSTESAASNWTKGEVLYSVNNVHSIMFSAGSSPSLFGSSSSTNPTKDLQQRKFRGYLAVDEIDINKHDSASAAGSDNVPCKGHCNFDGDLCGWTNAENNQEDDFDWSFGRGSENLFTGPARDYISSTNNEPTGSYLFTDSSYPRRPGDRAVLISPMFQPTATNDAMCMRLAVHMFGSGIGSLAIKIRYADPELALAPAQTASSGVGGAANGGGGASSASQAGPAASRASSSSSANNDLIIWEMSGDAGNNWHQAQTSVSSSKSPFQVLVEGVIGENHLGNIAIDEISFSSGPCPTSPPVASKNYGDCTFEQSMCYWRNPDAEIHLDDLDWIKTSDEQSIHGPNFDHTLKKRFGSYLKLENTFKEPKSGTRAFLLSPIFQPKAQGNVQCLSFYYYMFMRSISSSGPNLGTIRVYLASNNELVPIWRLTNPISSPNWKHARASLSNALIDGQPQAPSKLFQIAFEGIWGDARGGAIALDDITVFDGACDIMPAEAKSVPGECTFDVDMCSWTNKTADLMPMNSLQTTGSLTGLEGSTDTSKSPFLQSVSQSGQVLASSSKLLSMSPVQSGTNAYSNNNNNHQLLRRPMSWQLATIDSRPVNLQDHTYKAPIGYVYVDILENGANNQKLSYVLQSFEVVVQSGQQVGQCLSFWYAAYGRQDSNQLNVYLTQASAPPPPPEDGEAGGGSRQPTPTGGTGQGAPAGVAGAAAAAGSGGPQATASGSSSLTGSASSEASELEQANSWKLIDGKLLWSLGLKNVTESNRRKWQYGQTTLKADSNYIIRFVAQSTDGGFALDDISYYDGPCETRPALARVSNADDDEQNNSNNNNNNPSLPGGTIGGASSGGGAAAAGGTTNSISSSQGTQQKP